MTGKEVSLRKKLAVLFVALNVVDICLTLYFVGNGTSTELNPLMVKVLTLPLPLILDWTDMELKNCFKKIRDENEHLAEFIDAALDIWKDNPPPTPEDQLSTLFIDLVLLTDMFRRQEEVDNLSKNLGE